MRNCFEMFLRVRRVLEFSHGQDPKRTSTGLKSRSVVGLSRGRGMLSFRSEARETLGSETARVHHAARRRGYRVGSITLQDGVAYSCSSSCSTAFALSGSMTGI